MRTAIQNRGRTRPSSISIAEEVPSMPTPLTTLLSEPTNGRTIASIYGTGNNTSQCPFSNTWPDLTCMRNKHKQKNFLDTYINAYTGYLNIIATCRAVLLLHDEDDERFFFSSSSSSSSDANPFPVRLSQELQHFLE